MRFLIFIAECRDRIYLCSVLFSIATYEIETQHGTAE
jgi:hypothetical protein